MRMMPVIGMMKPLRLCKRTRCNLEQRPQYPSKLNLVCREDVGAWRTHSSATLDVACELMKLPSALQRLVLDMRGKHVS